MPLPGHFSAQIYTHLRDICAIGSESVIAGGNQHKRRRVRDKCPRRSAHTPARRQAGLNHTRGKAIASSGDRS